MFTLYKTLIFVHFSVVNVRTVGTVFTFNICNSDVTQERVFITINAELSMNPELFVFTPFKPRKNYYFLF